MTRPPAQKRKPVANKKARTAVPQPTDADEAALRAVLAHNLRIARAANRISQTELARLAETSQKYLSEIENGNANVGIDLLARLSRHLGVPAAELLTPVPRGPKLPR